MSEAALEEVSVLSSIYCGEGEFQLVRQSAQDGLLVQINSPVCGGKGLGLSLLFHLHPRYPSCPPDVSVSSAGLSRTQCRSLRQRLLDQAAALPPEPMVHQLVEWAQQCEELAEDGGGGEEEEEEADPGEGQGSWTAVLSLDHIRSRSRYTGLLRRWTEQLQLTGMLLLGRSILVVLQGARPDIKEFCRLLKTAKVDVDSSGRKCKERMMKVLVEAPSPPPCGHGVQSFEVREYQSLPELSAALRELHVAELCQQVLPSLSE